MSARLRYSDKRGAFEYVDLDSASSGIWLGRGADCQIRTEHLTVSTRHCRIHPRQGRWCVSNESRNGTFVNDEEIKAPVELRNGDVIACGKLRGLIVTFCADEEQQPGHTAPPDRRNEAAAQIPAPSPAPEPTPASPPREPLPDVEGLIRKLNSLLSERDGAVQDAAAAHAALAQAQAALQDQALQLREREVQLDREGLAAAELRRRVEELDALQLERRRETIRAEDESHEQQRRADMTEETLRLAMQRLAAIEGERDKLRQESSARQTALFEREHRITQYQKDIELLRKQREETQQQHRQNEVKLTQTLTDHNDVMSKLDEQRKLNREYLASCQRMTCELQERERAVRELVKERDGLRYELTELRASLNKPGSLPPQHVSLLDLARAEKEALQRQLAEQGARARQLEMELARRVQSVTVQQQEARAQTVRTSLAELSDLLADLRGQMESAAVLCAQSTSSAPTVTEALEQCGQLLAEARRRLRDLSHAMTEPGGRE